MHEALKAFEDKAGWKQLMLNGMSRDFSWTNAAREYVRIYERVVPAKQAEGELSRV